MYNQSAFYSFLFFALYVEKYDFSTTLQVAICNNIISAAFLLGNGINWQKMQIKKQGLRKTYLVCMLDFFGFEWMDACVIRN